MNNKCYTIRMTKKNTVGSGISKIFMGQGRVFIVLSGCALLAVIITYILFKNTEQILKERLQDRLIAIVATAATQFDPEDIIEINENNDLTTVAFERVVSQLEKIRDANQDIQYAYLMRRTEDIDTFEFVADAESLLPLEELDFNENGVIEDDEAVPLPGDPFDVSQYPTLRDEAFFHPVAANELEEDQWSVQLSAYAPIYYGADNAIAIVGIDVVVENFKTKTQAMLLPFMLFVFFLVFLLSLMTVMLVRFYGERVSALREIDRQKDELLGIVSHQLATPVSSVKWYLEMMRDGDVGQVSRAQKDHIDTMQGVVDNLVDLVQMILDVSRIQLGRMKVDKAELNLKKFFDDVLDVIEPKAKEKNINLKVNIPSKLPVAMLDKRLLRMTIENVLSNAVKYTPKKGKVEFTVEVSKGILNCTVSDTGCGIPKDEQGKMFTKLYRASNVRKMGGNGFGLYVAKGAVESQGGTISFTSVEDKGSTFRVILPLKVKTSKKK